MLQYGLTDKDREQLEYPKQLYSGFGRDANDFIHFYIYDMEDNLLEDDILKPGDVLFRDDNTIDLDIGGHVRDLGYEDGQFKVKYLFLRRLAGKKETIMVNDEGFINMGKISTKVINGKTRYFKGGMTPTNQTLEEVFPKEMKYVVKEVSPSKNEVKVDVQLINNVSYRKNFAGINKDFVYVPKRIGGANAGTVRWDKTDGNVLIMTPGVGERGFTDAMVGGEVVVKGMYEYTLTETKMVETLVRKETEVLINRPTKSIPPRADEKKEFFDDIVKTTVDKEPVGVKEILEKTPGPDQDYDDYRDRDDYGSVCFTGDTKIKLSNNRTIPIKMMRPGMKVKTEQGYAKVLKVVKDNRPYGDKLVRYKNLTTTDHHPIKHQGKWHLANEVGTEFKSEALDVWNLILDKHHTIIANNITSATLGKWNSINHFLDVRDKRINMLRLAEDFEDTGGGGGGSYVPPADPSTSEAVIEEIMTEVEDNIQTDDEVVEERGFAKGLEPTNEYIVDKKPKAFTKEIIEDFATDEDSIAKYKTVVTFDTELVPIDVFKQVPVDYVGKVVEILDFDRIRVDTSYEEGANKSDHSGPDRFNDIFTDSFVTYRKNKITRLNTYMVTKEGYHLCINMLDAPKQSVPDSDKKLPIRDVADRTARYVKTYTPLPDTIEKNDLVYFVEEKMEPYEDMVKLTKFVEEDPEVLFLRVPNLNSTTNPINFRSTNFKKYDDLIGTDTSVQDDITNHIHSSSLLDVQLGIDYSIRTDALGSDRTDYGFGNFVNFGGAENRIRNFKKKIKLIEGYKTDSHALINITSSADTRASINMRKREVINSFDPYENYLYTVSSSYATSSLGEFYDASWPKTSGSREDGTNFILEHTSGSTFTTWFDTWTGYAKDFDTYNQNRLVNNLPLHVASDTENKVFLDFMDMTGQQFDEIWGYIRHFTDINERSNKLSEGISKDIVREVAKSMGFEVDSGNDLVILPEYLLGKTAEGQDKYESPQEAVTEEIWKRILANMPFFMKNKGNQRAMKGLINCYGIPSSILRIREYGGPDLNDRVSHEIKRKFSYAADFKSSEYLQFPWQDDGTSGIKPETIEFRFRAPTSKDMTLVQKGVGNHSFAIQIQDNGLTDAYGKLKFSVSASTGIAFITSSLQPYYNNDMWSVMLTRVSQSGLDLTADGNAQDITYQLTSKQYDATRQVILYQTSESVNVDGNAAAGAAWNKSVHDDGTFYVGGNGEFGTRFSGSMQEFRLWSEPLSQSVFDNHVQAPKSYNGNTTSSAYDNLIFRLPLNDNTDLNALPESLDDKSYTTNYFPSASAVGFSGNPFRSLVDQEKLRVPNIGPQRRNATKIRTEATKLTGNLSSNIRVEASSLDFAPIDSNKLGVFFSPTDVVNEDIMYSLADINLDNEIGDPRDQYADYYRGLDRVQRDYWKKYSRSNNFWDYMRIIEFFDGSIWKQLRAMIPARTNATLGLLVEPNILERSKQVVGKIPEFENTYYENAGHFGDGIQLSSRLSSSASPNPFTLSGEYPVYESEIILYTMESGSVGILGNPTLNKIDEIDPRTPFLNLYATASITFGDIDTTFEETVQPFITASRLSEHNDIKVPYYTSSLSDSIAKGYGYHTEFNGNYQFSASFERSSFTSVALDSSLFRLFYKGSNLTKDNTIDGLDPVEITITTPTKLVTQEPGDSKLKVE